MSGTLPSANKPSLGGRVAKAAAKGTLHLGSATFNKMFPTIGRAMARVSGSKDADGINTSSEDISRNLARQTDLTRTILENQQEQNRILEKILTVYSSGQSAGGVTPAPGPTPGPTQTPPPPATPGLNFEIPMPELPDRRQPPRQQPQRPAPAQRPPTSSAPSAASRAANVMRAGARVATRFLGFLGIVVAMHEGLSRLGEQALYLPVNKRGRLTRTIDSLRNSIEDYRIKLEELQKEENEDEAKRLEKDLEDILTRIQTQRDAIIAMATDLDRDLDIEKRRRGNRVPREFSFTQSISQIVGQASELVAQPVVSQETERAQRLLAASIEDESSFRPASGSMGASMDAEMGLLQEAQDRARSRGSIGSSMDAEFATVSASVAAQSAAVRVEGDTIIYDFEKIKFEAERIKFEGLSLPTQQTMAEPTGSAPPATPSLGGGSGGAAPAMATAAGGGPPPASGGMQPIQMMNQAPTVSPMVQGMMDRRQGGTATSGSAAAAMQFFQSSGWSPAQAAGLAANLQVESNFNPSAVGDGGRAYGIAQWHPDRQAAFQRWSGQDIRGSTFEQQLGFINFELTQGNERRAGTMIRQATTPEQAAAFVDQYYERSNGHARQRRMQLAASFASNMPIAAGQQPVAAPSSSAPALAQASVDRIAANREQISNTHRMLREFNQNSPISNEQLRQQEASRIQEKKQMAGGEVSLRDRLLSVFDSLARAS